MIYKKLDKLTPQFRLKVELLLAECDYIFQTETYRTQERQHELYGKGRTAEELKKYGLEKYAQPKLKIVTKTLDSRHKYGQAIDIAFDKNKGYELYPTDFKIWRNVADRAKKYGIDWSYDLFKFEQAHFQDNNKPLMKDLSILNNTWENQNTTSLCTVYSFLNCVENLSNQKGVKLELNETETAKLFWLDGEGRQYYPGDSKGVNMWDLTEYYSGATIPNTKICITNRKVHNSLAEVIEAINSNHPVMFGSKGTARNGYWVEGPNPHTMMIDGYKDIDGVLYFTIENTFSDSKRLLVDSRKLFDAKGVPTITLSPLGFISFDILDYNSIPMFSDISTCDTAMREAIERIAKLGIVKGQDGKYRPFDTLTRGEMAVIADRIISLLKNS